MVKFGMQEQAYRSPLLILLLLLLVLELSVPRTRLSTYGDRAFPVAAVRIWNSLPQHITSAPSLPVFCSRLKTYFFFELR